MSEPALEAVPRGREWRLTGIIFFSVLALGILYATFMILWPFLTAITVGAILVTLFGPAFLNVFPGIAGTLQGASLWTKLDSLFLPALALALVLFGYIARMARAGTMEALDADFTRTATLKGLRRRDVMRRHVLRNGLLPTIAVISTQVGYLFGGIVAIEKLFGYPGIGFLTLTAAQIKNFPMLLACVLVLGVVYFVATLTGDLLMAALNPRVRLGDRQ